ncbi:MAG: transposase [Deltaproteobacteria bacterium]|nr:PIN domain-containing protein [Deltaproteobacteria bacterium]MBW2078442.1 PIN domain-containing protein [Deltaproteobacteria bacterium]RLB28555.1 MAG: transposase [Deltaproteobacteria bacterium]
MGRADKAVVYLDTHIVVWLYAGLTDKFTDIAKKTIDGCDVLISQFIRLELQYLFEIARIKIKPETLITYLSRAINLKVTNYPLDRIIEEALKIDWTRDVFDRLLVAEASARESGFITADENIQSNFRQAIW